MRLLINRQMNCFPEEKKNLKKSSLEVIALYTFQKKKRSVLQICLIVLLLNYREN